MLREEGDEASNEGGREVYSLGSRIAQDALNCSSVFSSRCTRAHPCAPFQRASMPQPALLIWELKRRAKTKDVPRPNTESTSGCTLSTS